ncbi:2-amino-4-hydroxy-6-hydroxymethyldihydropteridine diphosphokinase [Methylotenera sp.]|uniref:2-amino-4-hydroxy-6- hydroxymethyldihydropteridine diphosphokinase n=1 Tax=Methylotenera sp. TaxID=2051956 RepID=UPI00271BC9A0|nr:2-amino-4-hydroxy-6-hydroxymethyldihydropteridine diphosphokinase [Methylotenera sp.]MDO9206198.1 2-amino-4-hydroxy-6-hydroxymethyldihydropteridine diphosphokinase [Methylotenera sp.]MDO9393994.1 2-amino-4-hydroxy-6-hydroxymethyldihydropteridine diphosphokinase [Methylotenera sp.]MDP1523744.1 2-amino-4-hydroxy-6-hydroxymethyldihydropteridine diphosphokinase [Methylotenera sp.]MDP2070876.1 2-amino-4-hydroxy-6-hydroxymethyldihydropteridine diphosphokinase [Methylotenera sp.]MDP2230231.1 2-ami
MKQAFVALGSNLVNPVLQVQTAFVALSKIPDTHVLKQSSLYQTAPIGYDDAQIKQVPDFINAVVELETDLTPLELLDALFEIENQAGRERPYPNAPRVLDCDLLLYENMVINTNKLTLPHPRMHTRGFVLLPLFEIAPHLSIPNHGKIATLIHNSQFTGIKKL